MYCILISTLSVSMLVAIIMWAFRKIDRNVDLLKREIFLLSKEMCNIGTAGPFPASIPPPGSFPVLLELDWQHDQLSYIVALFNSSSNAWISCETGVLLDDYKPSRWWTLPLKVKDHADPS